MSTANLSVLGLPTGLKEAGKRVDFRPDDFTLLVETKGYRLIWSRAAPCPCQVITEQITTDPNCELCSGKGWYYFAPNQSSSDQANVGEVTPVQQKFLEKGVAIRAIMTRLKQSNDPYEKISNWVDGDTVATVRWENRLAYYDKLVNIDALLVYAELKLQAAAGANVSLRYPAIEVNQIRSFATTYEPDVDFVVSDAGDVVWRPGFAPAEGTRLSIHYTTHPTYLVVEHPHVARTTPVKFKTSTPVTPQGDPRYLPLQTMVRYEFLVS